MSWFKLWYDSVSALDTRTQGWTVSGTDAFGVPEEDVEGITVPGRNGTVLLPRNRWNNVERTFSVYIPQFRTGFNDLRQYAMRCCNGYHMLEDAWNDAETEPRFYMARVKSVKVESTAPYFGSGVVTVVFDCQPQRWYKSGNVWHNAGEDYGDLISYNSGTGITTIAGMGLSCRAAIQFKGTGKVRFGINGWGSRYIDFSAHGNSTIIIDGETRSVHLPNGNNAASSIRDWYVESYYNGEAWPVYGFMKPDPYTSVPTPTDLRVSYDSSITDLQILPRWWTL